METLSDQILSTMTFEELRDQCHRILKFTDQEIKEKLCDEDDAKSPPEKVRDKYKYILDHVTEVDFINLKRLHVCKRLKNEGNILIGERKFVEAISKYEEGIKEARGIPNKELALQFVPVFRLNIAYALLNLGEYDKTIKECKLVLEQDPYNVKALYRIAAAYNVKGDSETALNYIKRIKVTQVTDPHVTKLYEELQARKLEVLSEKDKKAMVNKIVNNSATTWEDVSAEFMSHGLLIREEEAKELLKPESCTAKKVMEKINVLDLKRRFKHFTECPKVDTLVNDPELLDEMAKAIRDPTHEFTQKLKSQFKELTLDQVASSIKALKYKAKWIKIWKTITSWKAIVGFLAFVVLVVAGVMCYASYKRTQIRPY